MERKGQLIQLSWNKKNGGNKMELEKKISIHYQINPFMEGEGFLFEIEKGDLPYAVFGSDCMEVARAVEGKAMPYRKRESTGELVPACFDVKTELYNILRRVISIVEEDGSVKLGEHSSEDLFPKICGIAVKDANVADQVAFLLEEKGYSLEKKFH